MAQITDPVHAWHLHKILTGLELAWAWAVGTCIKRDERGQHYAQIDHRTQHHSLYVFDKSDLHTEPRVVVAFAIDKIFPGAFIRQCNICIDRRGALRLLGKNSRTIWPKVQRPCS